MWVRSQDKSRLLKVKYFMIDKNMVLSMDDCDHATVLGVYSSKEKAMKVLEKISTYIKYKYYSMEASSDYAYNCYDVNNIYYMPKDEEVDLDD